MEVVAEGVMVIVWEAGIAAAAVMAALVRAVVVPRSGRGWAALGGGRTLRAQRGFNPLRPAVKARPDDVYLR